MAINEDNDYIMQFNDLVSDWKALCNLKATMFSNEYANQQKDLEKYDFVCSRIEVNEATLNEFAGWNEKFSKYMAYFRFTNSEDLAKRIGSEIDSKDKDLYGAYDWADKEAQTRLNSEISALRWMYGQLKRRDADVKRINEINSELSSDRQEKENLKNKFLAQKSAPIVRSLTEVKTFEDAIGYEKHFDEKIKMFSESLLLTLRLCRFNISENFKTSFFAMIKKACEFNGFENYTYLCKPRFIKKGVIYFAGLNQPFKVDSKNK